MSAKCSRCNDTGWVCEEHPEQAQNHMIEIVGGSIHKVQPCDGAGMPCTCEAFPHGIIVTSQKNADAYNKIMAESKLKTEKPRRWVAIFQDGKLVGIKDDAGPEYILNFDSSKISETCIMREVLEIGEAELIKAAQAYNPAISYPSASIAFEAGARWMKAKMEGKE